MVYTEAQVTGDYTAGREKHRKSQTDHILKIQTPKRGMWPLGQEGPMAFLSPSSVAHGCIHSMTGQGD